MFYDYATIVLVAERNSSKILYFSCDIISFWYVYFWKYQYYTKVTGTNKDWITFFKYISAGGVGVAVAVVVAVDGRPARALGAADRVGGES